MSDGRIQYPGFIFRLRPKQPAFDQAIKKYAKTVAPIITKQSPKKLPVKSREIFIVHGHNSGIKETVARFLEQLKLVAIVLHEQANGGRTIIEKFEDHSKVGFAVVLATDDDLGRQSGETVLKPRARQNVILELGYFIGALGRKNVCVLHKKGVDLPSDMLGILYIPLDESGAWKFQLAKEIGSAGIDVDMNLI